MDSTTFYTKTDISVHLRTYQWSWVKFLKSKDDSYDVFSKFCIQIQFEKELKILKVRSDHGGEFENEPFEIFCENMELSTLLLELHSKMGL